MKIREKSLLEIERYNTTATKIAKKYNVTKSYTFIVINKLKKDGIVSVKQLNKREKILYLTPKGQEEVNKIKQK